MHANTSDRSRPIAFHGNPVARVAEQEVVYPYHPASTHKVQSSETSTARDTEVRPRTERCEFVLSFFFDAGSRESSG